MAKYESSLELSYPACAGWYASHTTKYEKSEIFHIPLERDGTLRIPQSMKVFRNFHIPPVRDGMLRIPQSMSLRTSQSLKEQCCVIKTTEVKDYVKHKIRHGSTTGKGSNGQV